MVTRSRQCKSFGAAFKELEDEINRNLKKFKPKLDVSSSKPIEPVKQTLVQKYPSKYQMPASEFVRRHPKTPRGELIILLRKAVLDGEVRALAGLSRKELKHYIKVYRWRDRVKNRKKKNKNKKRGLQ